MNLYDQIEKVDIGIQISVNSTSKGIQSEEPEKENSSRISNIPKKKPAAKKSSKPKKLKFESESEYSDVVTSSSMIIN